MEHSFWHDRWATNQIGFHQPAANPLLVTHCAALALPSAGRVLLPLPAYQRFTTKKAGVK